MRLDEIWRQMRTEEVRRRRALGAAGRIQEREARVAALDSWMIEHGCIPVKNITVEEYRAQFPSVGPENSSVHDAGMRKNRNLPPVIPSR